MYYESIWYIQKALAKSFYYVTENTIYKLITSSPSVPCCQKCRAECVTSMLHLKGEIRYCSLQTWCILLKFGVQESLQTWCILLKFGVQEVIVILTVMLMFWVNLPSQYNFRKSETSWLYRVFLLSDMFISFSAEVRLGGNYLWTCVYSVPLSDMFI